MRNAVETNRAAGAMPDFPFWFDLWKNRGWSRRVARNWQMDAAFRDKDRTFLEIVFPTLAPEQKAYVTNVLRHEEHR